MSNAFFRQCVSYWSSRIDESDIGSDWSDATERCWRCGQQTKSLQKCHILAKQFGGVMSPNNVILLCRECHDEAPDVIDPGEVWRWIKHTKPSLGYGTLKMERAAKMAVEMGADIQRFSVDRFNQIMLSEVGLHLMQSGAGCRIKPSSIAWAIGKACKPAPRRKPSKKTPASR